MAANSGRGVYIIGLLALSMLWAGTYVFVKVADHGMAPFTVMAARAVISFAFMLTVLVVLGKPVVREFCSFKRQWVFFGCGVLVAFMWFATAHSETVISASRASFLITFLPVSSWLIGVFLARTRVFCRAHLVGIIMAVIGIGCMIGIKGIVAGNDDLWSSLFYISGILAFSASATLNKRYCAEMDPFVLTACNLFYTTIILVVLALVFDTPFTASYSTDLILAVLALGVISTGVGYLIFYWLVLRSGAEFACMNGYLVPILGVGMGVVFLGESVTSVQLAGLVLALVGIYLSERKGARSKAKKS